jgi:hypothetical protein
LAAGPIDRSKSFTCLYADRHDQSNRAASPWENSRPVFAARRFEAIVPRSPNEKIRHRRS